MLFDTLGWIFGGGKPASRNRLKPAWNPIIVACKGLDALQIDACRVDARWLANIVHDGSPEALAIFPDKGAIAAATPGARNTYNPGVHVGFEPHDELGSASRFFYCARASATERGDENTCPSIKPLALMQWVVKLCTPAGGCVLDPFMGAGSTGLAALEGGFSFVGIDNSAEQFEIARKRFEASK